MTRDRLCVKSASFSYIPTCKVFVVAVMMAAVWPGGWTSSSDTGRPSRASMYARRRFDEIRRLAIRKPS